MSLHNLDNYEILDPDGKDVPEYMRGIVMIGLGYLVNVVEDMADKEVNIICVYACMCVCIYIYICIHTRIV